MYVCMYTHSLLSFVVPKGIKLKVNTLRMGDADLHFYITTVQDG